MEMRLWLTTGTAALVSFGAATAASPQDRSLDQRLTGSWYGVTRCPRDPPPPTPCFPTVSLSPDARPALVFDPGGTATVLGPDVAYGRSGASGIYAIETRRSPDGATELRLIIAGQDMGLVDFAGDTLVLSTESGRVSFVGDSLVMSRTDRYYVRIQEPLAQRLIGSWRFAKVCQYDVPSGVTPCSPITTPIEWLRFEEDGTAEERGGPNGPSGRYVLEVRDLTGGRTETLLTIGRRNMGQVSFVGDTLRLGMAYVDGADRYFVRMPEIPGR